ncbi:tol-pal system YbgF family protein [Aquidulcibacter sp.]|uniref:tol-pal system YbgF family protein n=1 Tax=Aquidulcibacter sp. TaxID=2052990 RepID=UPI0037BF4446
MATPQVASTISSQIGTPTSRAAKRALRLGSLLSLVALGAGLMLTAEPAWAQARGANPPVTAPKKGGPTPVAVPPISAEPISARLIIRLEQVERQAAELTGRIEVLEALLAKQQASQDRLVQELEAERANQSAVIVSGSRVAEMTTVESSPAAPADAQALVGDEVPAPAPPAGPDTLFTAAQLALQRGDYLTAESNLTNLVANFPTAPEGIEGRWLLGEARFVQSAWGPAAEAYLSYLDAAPQGRRASESLVRLAGAFGQLGNAKMRCSALVEFKRRTPNPDPTLKARADAEVARSPCPTT